jgi:hypothetical protein
VVTIPLSSSVSWVCNPVSAIRNPELNRLYRKVDHVSDEDQKAL